MTRASYEWQIEEVPEELSPRGNFRTSESSPRVYPSYQGGSRRSSGADLARFAIQSENRKRFPGARNSAAAAVVVDDVPPWTTDTCQSLAFPNLTLDNS